MGRYHCTVELLFDWFGIRDTKPDNFCFYLLNRLIQTSQTGGQQYSDTSSFSIPYTSPMFAERQVCYSALFTYLVWCHTGTISFPPSDIILAQIACPLSDVMFSLHSGITNLSLCKLWTGLENLAEPKHSSLFYVTVATMKNRFTTATEGQAKKHRIQAPML